MNKIIKASEIYTTAHENPETPLRKLVYETLDKLKIPFEFGDVFQRPA